MPAMLSLAMSRGKEHCPDAGSSLLQQETVLVALVQMENITRATRVSAPHAQASHELAMKG